MAEALHQAALLQALLHDSSALPAGWSCLPGPGLQHRATAAAPAHEADDDGLEAYRRNARATAARALQAVYPVFTELVGEDALQALAWRLWQQSPPDRGDLAQWGQALPALLQAVPELQDEPYLTDVARLEWLVHQALTAADARVAETADGMLPGLQRLAECDPLVVHLRFQPGLGVLRSGQALWSIWQAHQPAQREQPDRFEAVREAMALGLAESVVVWRSGWAVKVDAMDSADAAFTQALLAGCSLGAALAEAAPADFQSWLIRALTEGWLVAVEQAA